MKIFITADMEGLSTTSSWNDCKPDKEESKKHVEELNKEVLAACNGAIKAGAKEIVIRDAHHNADNIDINILPSCASLIRGWSGSPYLMVEGINNTFDASIFIGYHSAASRSGNPLSHTETRKIQYVKINDTIASEFMIYSYASLYNQVPPVFLSGDKMLVDESKLLYPNLITVPVKEGIGNSVICYNPKNVLINIEKEVERSLKQDLSKYLTSLPINYKLEICYKNHSDAYNYSFFPGVKLINDNTLMFETNDYYELLRVFKFIS
ncbi:MAG: M55 family metallopeptidase [Bacilli bacterium]